MERRSFFKLITAIIAVPSVTPTGWEIEEVPEMVPGKMWDLGPPDEDMRRKIQRRRFVVPLPIDYIG